MSDGKPRIAILSPVLSAISGVSTHANLLLGSRLVDEFTLLHFQVGSEGRNEGVVGRAWRLVTSPASLAAFILRRRVNIIHINTTLDSKAFWRDITYLITARLLGVRVVHQVHGGALPEQFVRHSVARRWVVQRVMALAGAVVVLSSEEFTAYKEFEPDVKLPYPDGVDIAKADLDTRRYNMNAPLRLTFVGRLVTAKGIFAIIEALSLLASRSFPFSLTFAGIGLDEGKLREAVKKAGLDGHVTFLGPLFGALKDTLLRQSDVFVFPSFSEGLPYSVIEAMAAGCVPVTTAVGALPDVIQHGVHGLFVPPNNAIAIAGALTVLDQDRSLLARMAHASHTRVTEYYTMARVADDLRRVYLSV